MICTINTDASEKNSFCGYAFWIVCNQGKIQKAGCIKQKANNIYAEVMSIGNALHTLKHSKFTGISKVIINTDCIPAIDIITSKSRIPLTLIPIVDEIKMTMMEICIKHKISIRDVYTFFEFRHVKAHSGKKDARSIVNEWCDRESKKYSRLLYNKRNGK